MQSPSPEQSVRSTGLPPGVEAGDLGPRFLAAVIDWLAPALVVGILNVIAGTIDGTVGRVLLTLLASLVGLAWFLFVWWMFATKAAGPGMRVMKLQLVGLSDGRPVGWLRYLGRYVILSLLAGTVIGLIVLLVLLLQNSRRQGLHDLVIDSVVIKERALAPRPSSASASGAIAPAGQPQYGPQSRSYPSATNPLQPPTDSAATPSPASADFPVDGQYPMHASAAGGPAPEGSPDPVAASNPVSTVFPAAAPPSVPPTGGAATEGIHPVAASHDVEPGDASAAEEWTPAENTAALAAEPGRPLDEGWVAGLDDGRDLDVAGLVLLGRNPQGRPGEDDAELIKIADDTRTVSKTHLALGVDANGMYVMDRGSTNGSTVTSAGGVSTPCPAGAVIQVDEGNIVSFGDHWLEIKRTPAPER